MLATGLLAYRLGSLSPDLGDSIPPRLLNPFQVTSSLGVEYPALSPDAEWLAYSCETNQHSDILVLQLGAGQAINRTSSSLGDHAWPSWSPAGRQVALNVGDGVDPSAWVMDAFAGAPRRVVNGGGDTAPVWSPDGTRLAYLVTGGSQPVLEILELATGQSRQLPLPGESPNRLDLAWSPDGLL